MRLELRNRKLEIIISNRFGYEGPHATWTQMLFALAGIFELYAGMYGYASQFYLHDKNNGTEGKWIKGGFYIPGLCSGLEPA